MKLLGNRIMIRRIEESFSHSGFTLVDPFKRGGITFEVLQLGRGRWIAPNRKKPGKQVFITPEVSVGQHVISDHWFSATAHPDWHQPEFLDYCDGRGRVVLDARFCMAVWSQQQPERQFTPLSHI